MNDLMVAFLGSYFASQHLTSSSLTAMAAYHHFLITLTTAHTHILMQFMPAVAHLQRSHLPVLHDYVTTNFSRSIGDITSLVCISDSRHIPNPIVSDLAAANLRGTLAICIQIGNKILLCVAEKLLCWVAIF